MLLPRYASIRSRFLFFFLLGSHPLHNVISPVLYNNLSELRVYNYVSWA